MAVKSIENDTFSGFKSFKNGLYVQEFSEEIIDVSHSSQVVTLNYSLGSIFFQTNAFSASATTVEITNAPITDNRIFTVSLITPNASNASFRPNNLTVNGSTVTIRWAGSTAPNATTTSSKLDLWSFTLLYRASTFTSLVTGQLNY